MRYRLHWLFFTAASLTALVALPGSCFGEPQVKQNSKGQAVEVSKLQENPGRCLPAAFAGSDCKTGF
jgi:hypothetical protein